MAREPQERHFRKSWPQWVRGLAAGFGNGGWRALYWACLAVFAAMVGRFYEPGTGFSSLISIGSYVDDYAVPALRQVPHYVYEESYGYDGTYYVQLALHPGLEEPGLDRSLDNPHYRARRMLLPWVAWVLGAGQPEWIVQAYACLNIACWFALAWLLWGWFPPGSLDHFIRWAGLMFSAGLCLSVRHALTDGPGLLLVALAVRGWEARRKSGSVIALALAVLAKETSVLAGALMLSPPWEKWRTWIQAALAGLCVVGPTAIWMVVVRARFGAMESTGVNNFTLPFAGLAEKLVTAFWEATDGQHLTTLLTTVALVTQCAFLLARWSPAKPWWRVGVGFALLTLVVSEPVWEGYPGAAPRVLLPMALAFNILVPAGRRGFLLLVLGNLSVVSGLTELKPPPPEFYQIRGEASLVVARGTGWYPAESKGFRTWRWSSQELSTLTLSNPTNEDLAVSLSGRLSTLGPRTVQVRVEGQTLASARMETRWADFATTAITVPAGQTRQVEFFTDRPALRPGTGDERLLSFGVHNLQIRVTKLARPESASR